MRVLILIWSAMLLPTLGACRSAYTATSDCVIGLSCEQAEDWWNKTPPDSYPCKAQDDAEDNAC